ncbi:hypothetical protein IC582_024168 [Cucumis melo]
MTFYMLSRGEIGVECLDGHAFIWSQEVILGRNVKHIGSLHLYQLQSKSYS